MSRKGYYFDNAVIEGFCGTLKAEYLHLVAPNSIDMPEEGVDDYVDYYNHERIKPGMKGLSAMEYRLKHCLIAGITTVQLLRVSSNPGRFNPNAGAQRHHIEWDA